MEAHIIYSSVKHEYVSRITRIPIYFIHICVCIYIYTYIYIYTHTYIYLHKFYSAPNVYCGDQIKMRRCWRNMQMKWDKRNAKCTYLTVKEDHHFSRFRGCYMYKTCKTPDFIHLLCMTSASYRLLNTPVDAGRQ